MALSNAVESLRKATLTSARVERLLASLPSEDLVELTNWKRLSVAAMSKLLAFAYSRRYRDRHLTPLRIHVGSEALLGELYRMHFFQAASRDATTEVIFNADELAKHERAAMTYSVGARYMPYEIVAERAQYRDEFYANCGAFLLKLQALFATTLPLLGYPPPAIKTFYRPSKELIENIHLHSGSWGFGGARITNEGLEVSYVDLGCGIRQSLLHNSDYIGERDPLHITDLQAIKDAFEWGVSGRQGEHRGTGLYEVRTFALERGGAVECRSGSAQVTFTPKSHRYSEHLPEVKGVQVTIFLPAAKND